MPAPTKLKKAVLQEITWPEGAQVKVLEKSVEVQFNPESLKVSLSNQKAGGDQRGGSTTQFVGQGATKLTFDLWFDVTAAAPDNAKVRDVRLLTREIAYFITPKKTDDDKFIAPGVRFSWGTFWFDGTMESLNETLDYFSEDGVPLRAQLSVALAQQQIQFNVGKQAAPGIGTTPPTGTSPQRPSRAGDTVQSMAGEAGKQDRWQLIANSNGIENPRRLPVGMSVDLNVDVKVRARANLDVTR